jgi:magnesium transporter
LRALLEFDVFPLNNPRNLSEALEFLRHEAENLDLVYYLYVVDSEEYLLGVISLRDLLLASPQTALGDMMDARVVAVKLEDEKEEWLEKAREMPARGLRDEARERRGLQPLDLCEHEQQIVLHKCLQCGRMSDKPLS